MNCRLLLDCHDAENSEYSKSFAAGLATSWHCCLLSTGKSSWCLCFFIKDSKTGHPWSLCPCWLEWVSGHCWPCPEISDESPATQKGPLTHFHQKNPWFLESSQLAHLRNWKAKPRSPSCYYPMTYRSSAEIYEIWEGVPRLTKKNRQIATTWISQGLMWKLELIPRWGWAKPGSCWLKHQLDCHARQRFRCPSQLKQIRVAF